MLQGVIVTAPPTPPATTTAAGTLLGFLLTAGVTRAAGRSWTVSRAVIEQILGLVIEPAAELVLPRRVRPNVSLQAAGGRPVAPPFMPLFIEVATVAGRAFTTVVPGSLFTTFRAFTTTTTPAAPAATATAAATRLVAVGLRLGRPAVAGVSSGLVSH